MSEDQFYELKARIDLPLSGTVALMRFPIQEHSR